MKIDRLVQYLMKCQILFGTISLLLIKTSLKENDFQVSPCCNHIVNDLGKGGRGKAVKGVFAIAAHFYNILILKDAKVVRCYGLFDIQFFVNVSNRQFIFSGKHFNDDKTNGMGHCFQLFCCLF